MGTLLQDLKFGLRMLAKNPGFTAVAVLTLALGIGANTAIFILANAVLLRPFPYNRADRIVRVVSVEIKSQTSGRSSLPDLEDWRNQSATFTDLAACWPMRTTLAGAEAVQSVTVALTTPELFQVFGVKPIMGRAFLPEKNSSGRDVQRAVISYDLWQTRFGRDAKILDRSVMLQGTSYRVVGVMPKEFRYPGRTDVWVPIASFRSDDRLKSRGGRFVLVVGRLKDGVSVSLAHADLATISARLAKEYPNTNRDISSRVMTLRDDEVGNVRPYLVLLLVVVSFVLLICCGNVANLFLARAASRRLDNAVRLVLGARRRQLIRQLIVEALGLSLFSGMLGLVLAYGVIRSFPKLVPVPLPVWIKINMDRVAMAFTVFLSLLTSLLVGLVPALQSSKAALIDHLREGAIASPGAASGRFRDAIVVAEIALALMLLNGAGPLGKTFLNLQWTDPGFRTDRLVIATVVPDRPLPTRDATVGHTSYFHRALEALRVLPGVVAVGGSNTLPYTADADLREDKRVETKGSRSGEENTIRSNLVSDVSPDYFRAMGIPIIKGRSFSEYDTIDSPPAVIVDQRTAAALWPGRDPVGQQLKTSKWAKVVGVVGNVKYSASDPGHGAEFYFPYKQFPPGRFCFVVRTEGEPQNMIAAIRKAISGADTEMVVTDVKTMNQIKDELLWQQRLWSIIFGILAALATVLAGLGVFAVMLFATMERTHEIAIRMALGAQQRQVISSVVAHGLRLTVLGAVLGGIATFNMAHFLSGFLFGVRATDTATFATVLLILTAITLLACYIPARWATKVDPIVALRHR